MKTTRVLVSAAFSLAAGALALAQPISATSATWFNPRNGETTSAKLDATAKSIAKPTTEAWLLLAKSER